MSYSTRSRAAIGVRRALRARGYALALTGFGRLTRSAWCFAACAAALVTAPIDASASTVALEPESQTLPGGEPSAADVLHFRAEAGERNAVSAQFAWDPGEGSWTITDANAVIVAVAPCRSVDAHTVTCTAAADRFIDHAEFDLGDLDDTLRSASPAEDVAGVLFTRGGAGDDELVGGSSVNVLEGGDGNDLVRAGAFADANRLNGGPGNDRLFGSRGFDELDGGGGRDQLFGRGGDDLMTDGDRDGAVGDAAPGPDLFDGGSQGCCLILPGDRVIYGGRTAPVIVDLADERPDGEVGEGDVLRGIESVQGGSGDDRLLGDRRANVLMGGNGRDRLVGRAGADRLIPGLGGSWLSCGPDLDAAAPRGSRDLLDRDCETLDLSDRGLAALPASPRRLPTGAFAYRLGCPEDDSDGESDYPYALCRGDVQLRQASGHRRLLANGTFPSGHWEQRTVILTRTRLGRRIAARERKVAVRIELHSKAWASRWRRDVIRWTVRMRF